MNATFPHNKTLIGMTYSGTTLTIQFGKYQRRYSNVPQAVAYKLAYSKSASDTMSIFSNEIKNQYKVEVI